MEPHKSAPISRFVGFPDKQRKFLRELTQRQDRDWFRANKDTFAQLWEQPLRALLFEVREALRRDYRGALSLPHVFRMYRDVRFSRDKLPLKNHVGGMLEWTHGATAERMQKPLVLYFHVGPHEVVAAAGRYVMQGAVLSQFREQLLDPRAGAQWTRLLASLQRQGFTTTAHDQLKTAPRGIDPTHPRIALLRLKGLVVRFPAIPEKALTHRNLVERLVSHARLAAPLVQKLGRLGS